MDGEEHDENLLDGEEEEGEGVDQVKTILHELADLQDWIKKCL